MRYPLDGVGVTFRNVIERQPLPFYPYKDTVLEHVFPQSFFEWSLQLYVPVTFALLYYTIAHSANHFQSGRDHTKGDSTKAKALRFFVVAHNAGLCLYSFLTFALTAPIAIDMLLQGYRAAGREGLKLALCSIPSTNSLMGRWTYIFYLSKMYEVMDSVILYLKGKKIGNLQSYHHAGALISMWLGYRLHAQGIWLFLCFNSGVHTLMYAYYYCAAQKLPFPRVLKRNLTTLQILQIASGTIIVNTYFFQKVDPDYVYTHLVAFSVKSYLPAAIFASRGYDAPMVDKATQSIISKLSGGISYPYQGQKAASMLNLITYARQRNGYPAHLRNSCLETTGAAMAIIGNTMYMAPLLVLFGNFYIQSYLKQGNKKAATGTNGKAPAEANGNGKKH